VNLQHALDNNVALYRAVLAAHGAAGRLEEYFWTSDEPVPPYYSNLVTRTAEVGEAAQSARLRALTARPPKPEWGFKDSSGRLDPQMLQGLGLRQLFEARWYGWEAGSAERSETPADIEFENSDDEAALAAWETAWQQSSPAPGIRVFPFSLLGDANLCCLTAKRRGRVVGGALLNLSSESVGLSNVLALGGLDPDALNNAAARERDPDRHVLGYGPADELDALAALGFRDLGGLSVWVAA
jgi:hypothetical protein